MASGTLGLLALRLTRTTSDFYVASRTVGPLLNAAAISGEYLERGFFYGRGRDGYEVRGGVLWYPVGYATGYLFLLLFVAAPLRRFGAYTVPDYAEGRFNSAGFRKIAVIFVMLIGFFYMLPQMKGAGLTLQAVLHVPYFVGVVVVGGRHDQRSVRRHEGHYFCPILSVLAKTFCHRVPVFRFVGAVGQLRQPPTRRTATADSVPTLFAETTRSPTPRKPATIQRNHQFTLDGRTVKIDKHQN